MNEGEQVREEPVVLHALHVLLLLVVARHLDEVLQEEVSAEDGGGRGEEAERQLQEERILDLLHGGNGRGLRRVGDDLEKRVVLLRTHAVGAGLLVGSHEEIHVVLCEGEGEGVLLGGAEKRCAEVVHFNAHVRIVESKERVHHHTNDVLLGERAVTHAVLQTLDITAGRREYVLRVAEGGEEGEEARFEDRTRLILLRLLHQILQAAALPRLAEGDHLSKHERRHVGIVAALVVENGLAEAHTVLLAQTRVLLEQLDDAVDRELLRVSE